MKLLVIDMQKGLLVDELYNRDKIIDNILKLINKARKTNNEVIYFKHDAGSGSGLSTGDDAFEISEEVKPLENEKVFIKTINSCFSNTIFSKYLEESSDKDLMILGLQTEFCIDATIKSAYEKGYNVFIPLNTNSTFDNDIIKAKKAVKLYSEWIWPGCFGNVISMKDALKMIKK